MSEVRKFSVHPNIIYNLIVAQSGTLGKAVLECVMNSIDAGATRVEIEATRKGVTVQDDGQGFRSRKEIEDWFEVFGFPHDDGDRIYGKFGIGRGQLWSFCSTVWRTGTFEMDVDIKQRGLDYRLRENLDPVTGVLIKGKFYTPLTTLELSAFEKELAELARYAQIPVILNGKELNKDPRKEKWDFETDDAWIKVTENGHLAVYNLGVLVRRYPSYQFGCGGTVVTKPGVQLALNMARNDILVAECAVWKRIRKYLQDNSDERVRTKKTRLSDAELENLAKRFVNRELPYSRVTDLKLITDIVGRGHTIRSLVYGKRGSLPLTVAPKGSQLGERAHTGNLAFVLSEITLERFGAESVKEFRDKLVAGLKSDPSNVYLRNALAQRAVAENVQEAAPVLQEGYAILKDSELTKHEKAAKQALAGMAIDVSWALRQNELVDESTRHRTIYIGVSDVAEAWTDGRSRIVVDRRQLKLMREGIGGFAGLANLLVHEFLHDSSDTGTHVHDLEFYERYHEATCGRAGILNHAIAHGFARWRNALTKAGLKLPATAGRNLEMLERAESAVDADEEPEST